MNGSSDERQGKRWIYGFFYPAASAFVKAALSRLIPGNGSLE
jgi:hypothetical protein